MKKEYDLSKLKKVGRGPVANPKTTKVQTSIRLDGDLMAWAQSEAHELGLGYQTFINMKLREVMEIPSISERLEAIEKVVFKKAK
jgi:uncharacterized protein (DUF4415 family)